MDDYDRMKEDYDRMRKAEEDKLTASFRAEVADLQSDVELHKAHWTEAREERDKIRAWLCEKGYDAEYERECDVPGCPKAWESEVADLRARLAKYEGAIVLRPEEAREVVARACLHAEQLISLDCNCGDQGAGPCGTCKERENIVADAVLKALTERNQSK